MLDDSDLDFAILSTGGGGGLFGIIFGICIIVIIAIAVSNNKDECSKMHCPDGQAPKLMAHECLCVTRAVSR